MIIELFFLKKYATILIVVKYVKIYWLAEQGANELGIFILFLMVSFLNKKGGDIMIITKIYSIIIFKHLLMKIISSALLANIF